MTDFSPNFLSGRSPDFRDPLVWNLYDKLRKQEREEWLFVAQTRVSAMNIGGQCFCDRACCKKELPYLI